MRDSDWESDAEEIQRYISERLSQYVNSTWVCEISDTETECDKCSLTTTMRDARLFQLNERTMAVLCGYCYARRGQG